MDPETEKRVYGGSAVQETADKDKPIILSDKAIARQKYNKKWKQECYKKNKDKIDKRHKENSKRLRKKRISEGICPCGRQRIDKTKILCEGCRARFSDGRNRRIINKKIRIIDKYKMTYSHTLKGRVS